MATLSIRIDGALLRGTLEFRTQRIDFAGPRLLLGRGEGCDLRVDDPTLARQHVELDHADGQIRIRDLCSAQGIFRNHKHLASRTPWPIADGDVVRIGGEDFHVQVG